jgi:dihydrofolate synthase/folylpolyglutamate synthase
VSLDFLFGLLDPERYPRDHAREAGLVRTARLLRRLGQPQRDLRVVLVAGTKGKGSTAAMLAAVAQAAGRRVGLYVKPHLVDYRERIRVDGALIAPEALDRAVAQVRPHVEAAAADPEGVPTYFEVSVAVALLHFREAAVDLAVLEVGIGGRLDATNVTDPLLGVITPISRDHVDRLGPDLGGIAREKAGIARPGRPLVVAPQSPEATAVVSAAAAQTGAVLVPVASRARWEPAAMTPAGQAFTLRTDGLQGRDYGRLWVPLVGRHQLVNAATAVVAAEVLTADGRALPADAVRRGLERLEWPGRVEVVRRRPDVVVDVAHNPASMGALRDALLELWPGHRVVLVAGMVDGHDADATVELIAPLASVAVATEPRHVRAIPARDLAALLRRHVRQVEVLPDRAGAVARGVALTGPDDLLVVTGSFYLVGEARRWLTRPEAAPLPVAAT